jgi:type VI protein secretion system component VasF
MGAMKNLLIDAMDNVFEISRDLQTSTQESDLDEMKQALRRAIVNSALAIAFIEELELIGYVEKSK